MAPTSRVAVSVDLGAGAPIEVVAAVIGHLNAVCQLGGQLQDRVTQADALRAVLRRSGPWLEDAVDFDRYWRLGYLLALPDPERFVVPSLENAVATYIRENDLDSGDVHVERLTYENPVEIVLAVGAVVLAVLTLVRDWPDRVRINRARADDYENQVATRKLIRRMLVDGLASGQYPLRPEHIDDLLTKDATDAFRALGNSGIHLQNLEQPPTQDPEQSPEE